MGILLTILLILIFLMVWLIFVPVVVEVDTDHHRYQIRQRGTMRFWITTDFHFNLRIFGIKVPLKSKDKTHQPPTAKPIRNRSSLQNKVALIKGIFRSITLKWLRLDVDTDDVVFNAQLIPVCLFLSRGPVHLTTNFDGRVYASLRAEIHLYRIGWALLLFSLKQKMYGHQF